MGGRLGMTNAAQPCRSDRCDLPTGDTANAPGVAPSDSHRQLLFLFILGQELTETRVLTAIISHMNPSIGFTILGTH